jgi:hypothetical protein
MAYEGATEHHQMPGSDDTQDPQLRAQAETDAICGALCERLLQGTLPPDDAYWWTRIALRDVIARLSD